VHLAPFLNYFTVHFSSWWFFDLKTTFIFDTAVKIVGHVISKLIRATFSQVSCTMSHKDSGIGAIQ